MLCDIYPVEIPRVSLEVLRALEGLAPPISFILGFFSPLWLLVVGWGLGFTFCQAFCLLSLQLELEQGCFSSTVLNVKACPSHRLACLCSQPCPVCPACLLVGGDGWAALGMGTALSEVSARVSFLCSRTWYAAFCALENKGTSSLSS